MQNILYNIFIILSIMLISNIAFAQYKFQKIPFIINNVSAFDAKVHVIGVFDTHADNIAPGVEIDKNIFLKTLRAIFESKNLLHTLEYRILSGGLVTPKNVYDAINNLTINPNDVILFYYAGHGGTHVKYGHYLAMKYGNVFRNHIVPMMIRKNPRLVVVLTDSCGTYVDYNISIVNPTGLIFDKYNKIKDLFFKRTGLVDINAAIPGEYAYINFTQGSYWTYSLLSILERSEKYLDLNQDGFIAWSEVLSIANYYTTYLTKDLEQPQHPYIFYNVAQFPKDYNSLR